MKRSIYLTVVALVLAIALVACGGPQTAAPAAEAEQPAGKTAEQPAEKEAAEPVEAAAEDYANASREETLIIDKPSRLEGGDNWNPFVPGNSTGWGLTTLGYDPLILLSYGTGEIENWMAESLTSNEDATVWTLKLRPGITWNDGTPLTAADIVFSTELQLKTEGLGQHFTYKEWIASVEMIDELTVVYNLNKPNVRFALERYADNLCGVDSIVPQHVWEGVEDPSTFTNFDLEKGYPLSTGPYILNKVTENESIWVRNDHWWAAETGLKKAA